MSRVTLADIARKVGVSKAAVSLALRNSPEIGKATRNLIVAAAQSMGYRPDPNLSKIAASRWKSNRACDRPALAFIAPLHPDHLDLIPSVALEHPMRFLLEDDEQHDWLIYLSGHLHFKGALERANELGYSSQYHLVKPGDRVGTLANSLYHRGVQGIVFSPIFDRAFIREFKWDRFACVSVADHYFLPPTDFVVPKLSSHMHMVFSQLYRRGYKRPGIVLYHERIQHLNNLILRGVFLSLSEIVGIMDNLPSPCYLEHHRLNEIKAWIEMERPDVVIGFNDYVFELLTRFGYRMPGDFAFVSLATRNQVRGERAGVLDSDCTMGRTAIDVLDQKLRHSVYGSPLARTFTTIQTKWVEGSTLPAREKISSWELQEIERRADSLNIFPESGGW